MSEAMEVGRTMVEMVRSGPEAEAQFVEKYFARDVVSIEGQGSDAMPARLEGIDAIRGKHQWFYDNHTIHETSVEGPFVGNRDDQFAVRFEMEVTPNGGERNRMAEVGLYTVRNGKVAQEEFLYLMG
jgi:hypothetical protein